MVTVLKLTELLKYAEKYLACNAFSCPRTYTDRALITHEQYRMLKQELEVVVKHTITEISEPKEMFELCKAEIFIHFYKK